LLVSCFGIFSLPVTALSTFGPQCVQFLAGRALRPARRQASSMASSTLGNTAGVMLTAFVLIPHARVSTLLYVWLGVAVVSLLALLRLPADFFRIMKSLPLCAGTVGAGAGLGCGRRLRRELRPR
jgi:hypothetical protein